MLRSLEELSLTTIPSRAIASGCLLPPILEKRSAFLRYDDERDKRVLAEAVFEAGRNGYEFDFKQARLLDVNAHFFVGTYPNGRLNLRMRPTFEEWRNQGEVGDVGLSMNLGSEQDVLALQLILRHVGAPASFVSSYDFPGQLNDRPVEKEDGSVEMVASTQSLRNLQVSGVRELAVFDGHSPAFSQEALSAGIRIFPLTALPLLIGEAVRSGIAGEDTCVAVCDWGARDRGLLTRFLLRSHFFAQGTKEKTNTETLVKFTDEDLKAMGGKEVIIPEDRSLSMKTLVSTIESLLEAGVLRVTMISVYPELVNGASERLVKILETGKVTFITTDACTPLCGTEILLRDGVISVPVRHLPREVLGLRMDGINLFSDEGRERLAELGVTYDPWLLLALSQGQL